MLLVYIALLVIDFGTEFNGWIQCHWKLFDNKLLSSNRTKSQTQAT